MPNPDKLVSIENDIRRLRNAGMSEFARPSDVSSLINALEKLRQLKIEAKESSYHLLEDS